MDIKTFLGGEVRDGPARSLRDLIRLAEGAGVAN